MKEVVLVFKSANWEIVTCKDFQIELNELNEVVNIEWEQYGDQPLPYYINYKEIIGIYDKKDKKKDLVYQVNK